MSKILKHYWKKVSFFFSNPIPLSNSKISTYQTCPFKYKTIYIDRHPGKPSPYLAFGTVIHNALYEYEMLDPEKRTYEDLLSHYKEQWDMEFESYRKNWGKNLFEMIAPEKKMTAEELEKMYYSNGLAMMKNYREDEKTRAGKVRFVEKWVFGELFHHRITGRIDRIDQLPNGKYEIIDYKSGQRIYDEETLKDASRGYGLQAGLYYELCREAWRDRVDRFIFNYLYKKQMLTDYLYETLVDKMDAGIIQKAYETGYEPPSREKADEIKKNIADKIKTACSGKIGDKLLKKIISEKEEERLRKEILKISFQEEDAILTGVDKAWQPLVREYIAKINKILEEKINRELVRLSSDTATLGRYEKTAGVFIRKIVDGLPYEAIKADIDAFVSGIKPVIRDMILNKSMPALSEKSRELYAKSLVEEMNHYALRAAFAKDIAAVKAGDIEAAPDPHFNASRLPALKEQCLGFLRTKYAAGIDVITTDDLADRLAEEMGLDYVDAAYIKAAGDLISKVKQAAKINSDPGRTIPEEILKKAETEVLMMPVNKTLKSAVESVSRIIIGKMTQTRSDMADEKAASELVSLMDSVMTKEKITGTLISIRQEKLNEALKELFHDNTVVSITDTIISGFSRSHVGAVVNRVLKDTPVEGIDKAAVIKDIVEKLNWGDVEYPVKDIVSEVVRIYSEGLKKEAVLSLAEDIKAELDVKLHLPQVMKIITEKFEGAKSRVISKKIEVPYSTEIRYNVENAVLSASRGIREKDFCYSKGALCGWCEYQSGCPAWCRLAKYCKENCTGKYNCEFIYDEKTGTVLKHKPPAMSAEDFNRQSQQKFQVTDKSKFRLSFSKMNIYEMCPMNYRKLYLDRNPPKPKSFFSIGTSYHNCMEKFYQYDGPSAEPSLEYLKKVFNEMWVSAGYGSPQEEGFNYRRGLRMCEDYYREFVKGKYKKAFATEDYFEFIIDNTLLCGFIDRIDRDDKTGQFEIIDYKTNPKLYTPEELDEDQQMTIYYLAAQNGYLMSNFFQPFTPKSFSFLFVNFSKKLTTYRKPQDLEKFLSRVAKFTEEMEWRQKLYQDSKFDEKAGMLLYPPRENKYCQSCDHVQVCPLKAKKAEKPAEPHSNEELPDGELIANDPEQKSDGEEQ